MSWSVNSEEQSVSFELIVPVYLQSSWIGFGISGTGGMSGADIAIITLNDGGMIYDTYSKDYTQPKLDKIQDWKLEYLHIDNDDKMTTVRFSRYLITCDEEDNELNPDQFRHFIMVAYHVNDPLIHDLSMTNFHFSKHQRKQSKLIALWLKEDLFLNDLKDPTVKRNTLYLDIVQPNITIDVENGGGGQYWCHAFDFVLPQNKSVYAIAFELIGNAAIIHHATIYDCYSMPLSGRCDDMFSVFDHCTYVAGAGIGTALIEVPPNVHYEMQPGPKLLVVHYEPEYEGLAQKLFINDESGLRMYYKEEPSKYALGVMQFNAAFDTFAIQPNISNTELVFGITNECTNKLLPNEGITLIVGASHMHSSGQSMRIDRIRGNEVMTIFDTKQYDYSRQFAVWIFKYIHRNDTIRIHCFMDTTNRNNITTGGAFAKDEMCSFFFGYVPRMPHFSNAMSPVIIRDENGKNDQQVLSSSFCEKGDTRVWSKIYQQNKSEHIYENTAKIEIGNKNLKILKEDKKDFCKAMVYKKAGNYINPDSLFKLNIPFMALDSVIFIMLLMRLILYLIEKFCEKYLFKKYRRTNL
eukprot:130883_1